ncbi:MAG: hypothetical protein ACPF8V_10555 [Luteibaculum sp.]
MRIFTRISFFSLALMLFSCGGTDEKVEQVVNIYTHRHYDADKIVWKKLPRV